MSVKKATSFKRWVNRASGILDGIGAILLLILMFQGAADVIGRKFFNSPISGTLPRAQLIVAAMVFFSWGYSHIAGAHVKVDLIISRLSDRGQAIVNFTTTLMALILFGLITWRGIMTAKLYHEVGRLVDTIHWPLAPFQLLVSVGALVLCLVLITDLIKFFYQMKEGR